MKGMPRFLSYLMFAFLLSGGTLGAQDPKVTQLEEGFSAALSRVEAPLLELDTKYVENVGLWQKAAQEKGDLEGALAGKQEMESFKQKVKRDLGKWPELSRLRDIYDNAHARLAPAVTAERLKLYETFRRELNSHIERLTREGNLTEGVRLSERVKEVDHLIEAGKAATGPGNASGEPADVLWEFKSRASVDTVKECGLRSQPDGLMISSEHSAGAYHLSRRTFKPPFRIQARVATDSTNIRFYYNKGILAIFNWETNLGELRIHEPSTGRNMGFGGKGQLSVNQMHDIEIDVFDDRVVVRANGKPLVETPAKSAGLDAAVGIGPAFGSVLTVESMRVLELKP